MSSNPASPSAPIPPPLDPRRLNTTIELTLQITNDEGISSVEKLHAVGKRTFLRDLEQYAAPKVLSRTAGECVAFWKDEDNDCIWNALAIVQLVSPDQQRLTLNLFFVQKQEMDTKGKIICSCGTHFNTYSTAATQFLANWKPHKDHQFVFECMELARQPTASFQSTSPGQKQILLATEPVESRTVLMEICGHISMPNEVERTSDGAENAYIFRIEKCEGKNNVDKAMPVVIDARESNPGTIIRRSCNPNAQIVTFIVESGRIGVFLVALEDIKQGEEVTIFLDLDFELSDKEIKCVRHKENMDDCNMEFGRRQHVHLSSWRT